MRLARRSRAPLQRAGPGRAARAEPGGPGCYLSKRQLRAAAVTVHATVRTRRRCTMWPAALPERQAHPALQRPGQSRGRSASESIPCARRSLDLAAANALRPPGCTLEKSVRPRPFWGRGAPKRPASPAAATQTSPLGSLARRQHSQSRRPHESEEAPRRGARGVLL